MRILDINNTEIVNPDLSLGRLVEEKIFVAHHEAVQAVKEQGHYETIAEYPNGGKDAVWIVDVEGVQAKDAWDEYEDIYRYTPYTEDELASIAEKKPNIDDRVLTLEKQCSDLLRLVEELRGGGSA